MQETTKFNSMYGKGSNVGNSQAVVFNNIRCGTEPGNERPRGYTVCHPVAKGQVLIDGLLG